MIHAFLVQRTFLNSSLRTINFHAFQAQTIECKFSYSAAFPNEIQYSIKFITGGEVWQNLVM
jgi:hypothetical protein